MYEILGGGGRGGGWEVKYGAVGQCRGRDFRGEVDSAPWVLQL